MSAFLPQHIDLLAAGAIPAEVAEAAGDYSVTGRDQLPECLRSKWSGTGIVFLHHPLEGDPVPQYRPDQPADDGPKYVFPTGPTPLNVVPAHRDRLSSATTVLMVEGTKQTLAAVAAAPDGVAVVGVAGCWGWSRDGVAVPEVGVLAAGRDVVVAFDADISANPDVHSAGARLAEHLELVGARSVRFVRLPAGSKVGLDDFLAGEHDRPGVLGRLIERAGPLPKAPRAKRPPSPFFDVDGVRVVDVVDAVMAAGHYAAGPDGGIWRWVQGCYVDDDPLPEVLVALLGNRYRPMHRAAIAEALRARLRAAGRIVGRNLPDGCIPVRNGVLHVATGRLEPHDPAHLWPYLLEVEYDPAAVCPVFDKWIAGRVGGQVDDLLEGVALVLCPWIPQRLTVFLFGPTRSGKSTMLRVLEWIAGPGSTSAITMHALADNRFAGAGLYGKLLNVAGDLSDRHIDDLAIWKQVTGDDPIYAERKYRDAFTFHNRALLAFSANTPPTVAETSRAYLARVRPFLFPDSVEGREDRALEDRLRAELPGILNRLVQAAQRWINRGGYGPADLMVADLFAQESDAVAQWAAQALAANPGGFLSGKSAYESYGDWCTANRRGTLGRNRFLARAENTLGPRSRAAGSGVTGWRDVRALPADEWIDPDPGARYARSIPTPAHEETEKEGRSREGEGGRNAHNAHTDLNPTGDDPDEIIEVEF